MAPPQPAPARTERQKREYIEAKKRELQTQAMAVLQRQRAECAKMQSKLSSLKASPETAKARATVAERLRDIDAQLESLQPPPRKRAAESPPTRRDDGETGAAPTERDDGAATKPPLDGESILRKYSSTAVFQRSRKAARLETTPAARRDDDHHDKGGTVVAANATTAAGDESQTAATTAAAEEKTAAPRP